MTMVTTPLLEELKRMGEELSKCEKDPFVKPRGLKKGCKLHQHQLKAVQWLRMKEKQSQGGILADDMGLGKTLQIIALILKEREDEDYEHSQSDNGSDSDSDEENWPKLTLIVCPLSLMEQWVNEVTNFVRSRHSHNLSCYKYHGQKKIEDSQRLTSSYDIVITTYGTLRSDCTNKGLLSSIKWKRIVLDEAHVVRNPETVGSTAVCALQAMYRWCVTGTPVQNSLRDLYSLYKFLRMPKFDNQVFWEKAIGNGTNLDNRVLLYELLRATMLRRTKKQLKDELCMPIKTEMEIPIALDDDEHQLYLVISERVQLWAQDRHDKNKGYSGILLKRLALAHPNLLVTDAKGTINLSDMDDPSVINDKDPEESEESKADAEKLQILENNWFQWDGTKRSFVRKLLSSGDVNQGLFKPEHEPSKLKKLHELLAHALHKNEKAVIVSQWTKMLDLIAQSLDRREIKYCVISGQINLEERLNNCKIFNTTDAKEKVQVLLLQMNVGGAGLNLMGGNHLFIYDLHWNPQLMKQACDRVYRMGQTKEVFVYKFITKIENSIEDIILKTQEKKLKLFEDVMNFNTWLPSNSHGLSDLVIVETMRLGDGEEQGNLLAHTKG